MESLSKVRFFQDSKKMIQKESVETIHLTNNTSTNDLLRLNEAPSPENFNVSDDEIPHSVHQTHVYLRRKSSYSKTQRALTKQNTLRDYRAPNNKDISAQMYISNPHYDDSSQLPRGIGGGVSGGPMDSARRLIPLRQRSS